jgi:preprotein translocase subunit YajC
MNNQLLFLLLILLLFIPILLSGRKQKRQMQQMQRLQGSLSDGDVVLTTSGLRGTVVDASYEETVDLEIAPGVVTTWVRAAVREKVNPSVHTADHTDSRADSDASSSGQHVEPQAGTPKAVDAPQSGRGPEAGRER